MNEAIRTLSAVAAAMLLLAGCAESQLPEVTGKGNVRGLHAIVDGPEATFRIEERSLDAIDFKSATSAQAFDDLTYRFNFDAALPGDAEQTRIASRELTVVPDTDYVFVLTGSYDDANILLWESPERMFEDDEDVAEVSAGHLSTTVDSVDFYLTAPGTAPAAGSAAGSLSFGERLDNFDVDPGDYQVVLTAPGDPSTILFRSRTQTLSERTSSLFAVFDPDPSITSAISVRRIGSGGGSVELGELHTPPTRRYLHAAIDAGNVDVYVDDDFSAPLVADLAFGEVTPDIPVPVGETPYAYTAAGNTGAILHESDDVIGVNTRVTSFLIGPADDPDILDLVDDRRPVTGTSKLRIVQLSDHIEDVDIYLRVAGTDIDDVTPTFPNASKPVSTGYLRIKPGDYEVTVTENGEKTPVAPVLPLDLAAGEVAEVAILDTVDPAVLNVVRYD